MATSFSFSNFLSFLFPSNPPPPPLTAPPLNNLALSSSSSSSSSTRNPKSTLLSVSAQENQSSSSLSPELSSVICPSLAYANTLFFSSPYNVEIVVDEDEPEESIIGRFKREVMRAGILQECRRRRYHENNQDKKKRKAREAAKRNRKRYRQARSPQANKLEGSTTKRDEDKEDNWDMPDEDIPF